MSNSTPTLSAPWNVSMATVLAPRGCLEVAVGTFSPDAKSIKLSIASVVMTNRSSVFSTLNFDDILRDVTIVHFWGPRPNNNIVLPAVACTVPAYQSTKDIPGVVISPKDFGYVFDDTALHRSFAYTIGCGDVPKVVGNGAFYVQVWGQSSTTKAADGGWTPVSEPLGFNRIVVSANKDGWSSGVVSGDKSNVIATNCSAPTSAPTSTPTSDANTFRSGPSTWSTLLALGSLALALSAY